MRTKGMLDVKRHGEIIGQFSRRAFELIESAETVAYKGKHTYLK